MCGWARTGCPTTGSVAEAQGADVVGFARPHELHVVPDLSTPHGVEAVVSRVHAFGASVRVELDGLTGPLSRGEPLHFEAVVPRERAIPLTDGQRVRLVPTQLRVFRDEAA